MKVTFHLNFHTVWGQKICLVGSVPQLGSWQPALAKEMHYTGGGDWELQLDLPSDMQTIEYRYFLQTDDKLLFEEWEKNHRFTFDGQTEEYIFYDSWQNLPVDLPFYTSAFTKSLFAHPSDPVDGGMRSGNRMILKITAPRVEKNQVVAVTGNQDILGNWNPDKALSLRPDPFPEWSIDLDITQIHFPLEYKFLIRETDISQPFYWETGENRLFSLSAPPSPEETVVVSGLPFRAESPSWRCAGTVVPVFSLRSEKSFGVGDLGDLYTMVDWIKKTQQRIIQVLPMNDTTVSHTWRDSYPYSAISIYALHPMYICLSWLGALKDKKKASFYADKQQELNAKDVVDYEQVNQYKLAYCRDFFEQEGKALIDSPAFQAFFTQNQEWLMPYAAYCYLRDTMDTTDFTHWQQDALFSLSRMRKLCAPESVAWKEVSFSYFLQYILHTQFKQVSDYARENGVVLKGDLPIGVNRSSVETWTEPKYFHMDAQAGAPPDDFSMDGQNWSFPTYNWEVMAKDQFAWWKKRFQKLSDYFDCFRIDHILGFFRIWEIPLEYVQGLCGHFNPALPFSKEDIERYGMSFDIYRYTTAHINRRYLSQLFGAWAEEVESTYLAPMDADSFILKPFCDTQRKIEKILEGHMDERTSILRKGLFVIANEVLFLRDPRMPELFHPRISGSQSFLYQELSEADRYAFDQLYRDFFYYRHTLFWKGQAMNHLTPLVACTDILVCGEDLGMIPESVPEVMDKLQVLSLEIERMPKTANREFTDMFNLPYLSVCTTSTHDMSPIRNWWQEDREKIQRYYNQVLQRQGVAPEQCSAELATQIVGNHLAAPSMLAILPIQDWFAMDDTIKKAEIESERINIPADPNHYWRYRMHITLEDLMKANTLNEKIITLISGSGRR